MSNGTIRLESGRTWKRVEPQVTSRGVNNGMWVEDENDSNVRAWFKWPSGHELSSMYSIGIERTAWALAVPLGLPVSQTFLEDVGGHLGAVVFGAAGRAKTWDLVIGRTSISGF